MNKIVMMVIGTVLLVALAAGALITTGTIGGGTSALDADGAIARVTAQYPELSSYQDETIPPSSIETTQVGTTWYVGFLQSGSGVPGIVSAECYLVTAAQNVQVVGTFTKQSEATIEKMDLETCKPVFNTDVASSATSTTPAGPGSGVMPFGEVTLALNEKAQFPSLSIEPLSIEEDSRCAQGVQCIQAGTVRVKLRVLSSAGTSTPIVTLDQAHTVQTESVTLVGVLPESTAGTSTAPELYKLTFKVVPQGLVIKPKTVGECYIGGCSAHICSDTKDIASTCEFKEEYACYKTAACERQRDGACGWTLSAALTACLAETKAAPATE